MIVRALIRMVRIRMIKIRIKDDNDECYSH